MAGLIKKQVVKYLAIFCKNVDNESLNMSLLKGKVELPNIELDTDALHSLLSIPTWLQIDSAVVDFVQVKLPNLMSLTKTPIKIELSNVTVEVQILDTPRKPNKESPLVTAGLEEDGKDGHHGKEATMQYGMMQKIVEGISLSIESVQAVLNSNAFKASIMLGPIEIFSTDKRWNIPSELTASRIYDPKKGQVLTFKAINCQMIRIEATASLQTRNQSRTTGQKHNSSKWALTPLKVMLSQSEIRMILRRRTKDCRPLCTKIEIILDDLLWILTDSQVKAAMLCVKTVQEAMERSFKQDLALGLITNTSNLTEMQNQADSAYYTMAQAQTTGENMINRIKDFGERSDIHDFRNLCPNETSFHLSIKKVEFHLYEEKVVAKETNIPRFNSVAPNGACQLIFDGILADHYPAHRSQMKSREGFVRYSCSMKERDKWVNNAVLKGWLDDFKFLKQQAAEHGTLKTSEPGASKLYESVSLLHISDAQIYPVACDTRKLQNHSALINVKTKMIGKQSNVLPDEIPFLHFDFTSYFYPDNRDFPKPHSNIFAEVNAPEILVDWLSLEWLSQVALETAKTVTQMLEELGIVLKSHTGSGSETSSNASAPGNHTNTGHHQPIARSYSQQNIHIENDILDPKLTHIDLRADIKMAKLIILNEKSYEANIKKHQNISKNIFPITCELFYPKGIEVNISRAIYTNNRDTWSGDGLRENMKSSRSNLHDLLGKIEKKMGSMGTTAPARQTSNSSGHGPTAPNDRGDGDNISINSYRNEQIDKFPLLNKHASGIDSPLKETMLGLREPIMSINSLLNEGHKDCYNLNIEAFWIDWVYDLDSCFQDKDVPMQACERIFIEPTSLQLWMRVLEGLPLDNHSSNSEKSPQNRKPSAEPTKLEMAINVGDSSNQLLINHYQLQTILNIIEEALEAVQYFQKLFDYLQPVDKNGDPIVTEVEANIGVNIVPVNIFLMLEPFQQFSLVSAVKIGVDELLDTRTLGNENTSTADDITSGSEGLKNRIRSGQSACTVETMSKPLNENHLQENLLTSSLANIGSALNHNANLDVASEVMIESTAELIIDNCSDAEDLDSFGNEGPGMGICGSDNNLNVSRCQSETNSQCNKRSDNSESLSIEKTIKLQAQLPVQDPLGSQKTKLSTSVNINEQSVETTTNSNTQIIRKKLNLTQTEDKITNNSAINEKNKNNNQLSSQNSQNYGASSIFSNGSNSHWVGEFFYCVQVL